MFKLVFRLSFIPELCICVFLATMVKSTRRIASFIFTTRGIVYADLRRNPTRNCALRTSQVSVASIICWVRCMWGG